MFEVILHRRAIVTFSSSPFGLGERLDKQCPIRIPFEDGLASVASVHEVVNPSLILQSNLPCLARHSSQFYLCCQ